MNNWQQITIDDAILYCERSGFVMEEIDFFEMEIKKFYLPGTKIQFNYKIEPSDPVKFYICPTINEKIVSFEDFKKAVEENKRK